MKLLQKQQKTNINTHKKAKQNERKWLTINIKKKKENA